MNGPTFKGKDSQFCACVSPVTSLSFFNQLVASRLPRQIFVRSGQLCSVLSTSSLLLVRFHRFGKGMSPEDTGTESCKCNGVCSRKDGSKAKGCLCKTCGAFWTEGCECMVSKPSLWFLKWKETFFTLCMMQQKVPWQAEGENSAFGVVFSP